MSACSEEGRTGPGRSCRNRTTPSHRDDTSSCSRSENKHSLRDGDLGSVTHSPALPEDLDPLPYSNMSESRRRPSPVSASCRVSRPPPLRLRYTLGQSRPAATPHVTKNSVERQTQTAEGDRNKHSRLKVDDGAAVDLWTTPSTCSLRFILCQVSETRGRCSPPPYKAHGLTGGEIQALETVCVPV